MQLVGENERYERQVKVLCGNRVEEDGADGDHGCTDDSKEVSYWCKLQIRLSVGNLSLYMPTDKFLESQVLIFVLQVFLQQCLT